MLSHFCFGCVVVAKESLKRASLGTGQWAPVKHQLQSSPADTSSGSGPRVDCSFSAKCAPQAALSPVCLSAFWGSEAAATLKCAGLLPFHLNGERKANSILQSSLYQYSLYVAFDLL